jgi:hypothetical protein
MDKSLQKIIQDGYSREKVILLRVLAVTNKYCQIQSLHYIKVIYCVDGKDKKEQ